MLDWTSEDQVDRDFERHTGMTPVAYAASRRELIDLTGPIDLTVPEPRW